jgi:type VII secretion protein EccB
VILDRLQLRQPTTRLQVSGYRFLLRRIECALLGRDLHTANESLRAHTASLAVGCVLAAVAVAGCGLWGWLRPHPDLGQARIVMGQHSGARYVRVGDTWHPVLNLVSARLIAGTAANPEPVQESDLFPTYMRPRGRITHRLEQRGWQRYWHLVRLPGPDPGASRLHQADDYTSNSG